MALLYGTRYQIPAMITVYTASQIYHRRNWYSIQTLVPFEALLSKFVDENVRHPLFPTFSGKL